MPLDQEKLMAEALLLIKAQQEWILAVPSGTILPAMPGIDRDWADTVEAALAAGSGEVHRPDKIGDLRATLFKANEALESCRTVYSGTRFQKAMYDESAVSGAKEAIKNLGGLVCK